MIRHINILSFLVDTSSSVFIYLIQHFLIYASWLTAELSCTVVMKNSCRGQGRQGSKDQHAVCLIKLSFFCPDHLWVEKDRYYSAGVLLRLATVSSPLPLQILPSNEWSGISGLQRRNPSENFVGKRRWWHGGGREAWLSTESLKKRLTGGKSAVKSVNNFTVLVEYLGNVP